MNCMRYKEAEGEHVGSEVEYRAKREVVPKSRPLTRPKPLDQNSRLAPFESMQHLAVGHLTT